MSANHPTTAPAPDAGDPAARTDELQQRLVAFVRAFGLHKGDETPCGAPVPVSEAHALAVLSDRGPITQTELGRHLGLGKSTVSRLVGQLQARGWARRVVGGAGGADARRRTVVLTPEGVETAAGIARLRAERMDRLLQRIPTAERPVVLAALDRLVEAAREDGR